MKNWIISHKILAIALVCVLGVGVICAVVLPIALAHKHEFSAEWTTNKTDHWHSATCEHTDEKKDFGAHVWDGGVITRPADFGVVGERKFTCKDCGYSYTEDIDALGAKDNEIRLAEGKTLDRTYDGKDVDVSDQFAFNGNGEVTVTFKEKGADDNTYAASAPRNAGEYTVKVSVRATAEWKAASKTFDFAIAKKELTGAATKEYDGTATMPATLDGVLYGETVSATITMTSKNVGATVREVALAGADKDNYAVKENGVIASITPKVITVEWEKEYDNSKILTGEPAGRLEGDEVSITVTMSSADAGATVQDFEITGKDAGNYSLAREDVTAEIIKADISFEIGNAGAFTEFFVGATNIPNPTTDYREIGTGYGERKIVWEKHLGDGVWSRTLTKEEFEAGKAGTYRVRIQYDEGKNYNFGATPYVSFTKKVKERTIDMKPGVVADKMYNGKPVEKLTYDALADMVSITEIPGVTDFTSPYDGEKYVEYRKKGGDWTTVTAVIVPANAGEYEYRIGIKATDEWAATVSGIKTFTIKPYEFVLELGYGQNQNNQSYDRGKTFVLRQYENLIAGQKIELWLDNEKAGLQTREGNHSVYYFVPDQKKQVTTDCFFLKIANISSPNMENYKIVPKYSYVPTVEITVVEYNAVTMGKSGYLTGVNYTTTETWLTTTVKNGYFKVGHTVAVYNRLGEKVGEATITKIEVEAANSSGFSKSPSGFAIPSDGKVRITLDKVFKNPSTGGYIPLTEGYIKTK